MAAWRLPVSAAVLLPDTENSMMELHTMHSQSHIVKELVDLHVFFIPSSDSADVISSSSVCFQNLVALAFDHARTASRLLLDVNYLPSLHTRELLTRLVSMKFFTTHLNSIFVLPTFFVTQNAPASSSSSFSSSSFPPLPNESFDVETALQVSREDLTALFRAGWIESTVLSAQSDAHASSELPLSSATLTIENWASSYHALMLPSLHHHMRPFFIITGLYDRNLIQCCVFVS